MASLFWQIGGCQIDCDFLRRDGQSGRMQGGLNPFPAFRHGFVGKSDNVHADLSRCDHDLNVHRDGLNAVKCDRTHS